MSRNDETRPIGDVPGYVNGVRCIWPDIRRIEPEVKPCKYGHTSGRNRQMKCIACTEVSRRQYVAKKRAEAKEQA